MTDRSRRSTAVRPRPGAPGWLPQGLDAQLLAVALLDDERAARTWAALRGDLDLDRVDWDQHRLLPLVARGLRRSGVDDPDLPRLKGIHRQAWSRNQLLVNRSAPALGALADAGIPTLVLKGGALGLRYYDDLGLRPMADLDVLVLFDQAVAATEVLIDLGYQTEPLTRDHQLDHHGRPAAQPDPATGGGAGGGQIDLHWQVNMALGRSGPPERWSDELWAAAVDLDVAGHPTRMLCPADLLLHVCVHGAGWSTGARLRWVADAATVVARAGPGLDWDRLVELAVARRVVLAARDTLEYLADAFEVAVPAEVLARLRRAPTTRRDQLVYHLLTRPRPTPGRLGGLPITVGRYLCLTVHDPVPTAVAGMPAYLARSWDIDRPGQAPGRLAGKAARVVRGR